MLGFDDSQWWAVGYGLIVFGFLLIGGAVAIAVFLVDWKAIKKLRAAKSNQASSSPNASSQ